MEKEVRNIGEQEPGVMKGAIVRQLYQLCPQLQVARGNGKNRRRTDRLERQFVVIADGVLPFVSSGFDEMGPEKFEERKSIAGFGPVFAVMLKNMAHLSQLTEVHSRKQTARKKING